MNAPDSTWIIEGRYATDGFNGSFRSENVKADTLRAAVEKVEKAIPGSTVTQITRYNSNTYRD